MPSTTTQAANQPSEMSRLQNLSNANWRGRPVPATSSSQLDSLKLDFPQQRTSAAGRELETIVRKLGELVSLPGVAETSACMSEGREGLEPLPRTRQVAWANLSGSREIRPSCRSQCPSVLMLPRPTRERS